MAHEVYSQHAIPQEISTYQFRLVGDMTLKQFLQIAGGVLLSLIVYSSNLPGFVKWPIIVVFVLLGVALAFFKLEDRPLEVWIATFIRSIYSPTIFTWQPPTEPYQFFKEEQHARLPQTQAPVAVKDVQVTINANTQNDAKTSVPATKILEKVIEDTGVKPAEAPVGLEGEAQNAIVDLEENEQEFMTKLSKHFGDVESNYDSNTNHSATINSPQNISIPGQEQTTVEHKSVKQILPKAITNESELRSITNTINIPSSTSQPIQNSVQATYSNAAAPPITPTRSNILVGQVLDNEGKIIEGAILEVKDDTGRPVRAIKTNQLGHYGIVTPLFAGIYTITTEKDEYHFEPVSFTTKDEIIPPIAITGTKVSTQNSIAA